MDKKRKVSFRNERVPKKARVEKLCNLCKKHGGAHTTHNTGECRKYDKGVALKKGFTPKGKSDSNNESFAQIMKEGFAKVTKAFNILTAKSVPAGTNNYCKTQHNPQPSSPW